MEPSKQIPPLELWGGIECTVNRVGDRYYDQSQVSGHDHRIQDLDCVASLGVRAIRYPVLWERVAPEGLQSADWRWTDERLQRLRELGMRPIAGLVHHGSGPRDTNLADPAFLGRLAEFARLAAERYPWVEEWTPVNEPLTTARFSGLYGLWYPHGRDDATFIRCLMGQVRGTAEAMRAIREVQPQARLIQTEDLGKTFSTPRMRYQAEFENHRRWLTWDLLCGRVDATHPLYRYLIKNGAVEDLAWLRDNPCPPDVVGMNYYVTSERFLDERVDRYPSRCLGSNGRDTYCDVEAVRVREEGISGFETMLQETWERYRLPVAVTEAHLGCTREEQVRWLRDAWEGAEAVRQNGGDIRAVTIWSLFGAYDWSSLLTRFEGRYEPGAFDLRAESPRETALARAARDLGHGRPIEGEAAEGTGWWQREERLEYRPVSCSDRPVVLRERTPSRRPILILGATGTLGRAFSRICALRGLPYRLTRRDECDLTCRDSILKTLEDEKPWIVVNAAGFVRVDDAETESRRCLTTNVMGPAMLAEACALLGVPLVAFSSHLVFDGALERPYLESDLPKPLGVYGQSKAHMEREVLSRHPEALVIRTSAFFGPWDIHNFAHHALLKLASKEPFHAVEDEIVSPTYVPDLVHATLDLALDREQGLWHLANEGQVSWASFARRLAEASEVPHRTLRGVSGASLGRPARRPAFAAMKSERGQIMPSLDSAIERFVENLLTQPSMEAYLA